jgi:hypothetical protein
MSGRHATREPDPLVLAVRRWHETHPVQPLPAECVGGQAYPLPESLRVSMDRYAARRRLDELAER